MSAFLFGVGMSAVTARSGPPPAAPLRDHREGACPRAAAFPHPSLRAGAVAALRGLRARRWVRVPGCVWPCGRVAAVSSARPPFLSPGGEDSVLSLEAFFLSPVPFWALAPPSTYSSPNLFFNFG